jgi:hypothetical protein
LPGFNKIVISLNILLMINRNRLDKPFGLLGSTAPEKAEAGIVRPGDQLKLT